MARTVRGIEAARITVATNAEACRDRHELVHRRGAGAPNGMWRPTKPSRKAQITRCLSRYDARQSRLRVFGFQPRAEHRTASTRPSPLPVILRRGATTDPGGGAVYLAPHLQPQFRILKPWSAKTLSAASALSASKKALSAGSATDVNNAAG